ncbi:GAF domain-containing protein [Selenomonas sp.]|uniref:GAF domain-containing protein n=1 Tax=Selenomonas sp. TaxID=2053611 RepID=UPI002A75F046|nr:GAF domain-containing protein [Selenomonas sp.]MDY3296500.1 NAD(P)-dependent oxidoreductase [Selenomonas sp.]MDY4417255.1 NAD(P)-dependent oxidoreductase [Selenomonas sp.]
MRDTGTSTKTGKQKKLLFLTDVPEILARPLSACFEKEGWRTAALGAAKADAAHHRYAADVMSVEAEEIFALEDIAVLVAPLAAERADGVARLERLLALAKRQAHIERVLLLGSAAVFAGKGLDAETSAPAPHSVIGKRLARLETLALAWKAEGLPVTIVRLPELCGEGLAAGDGFLGAFVAATLGDEGTAQDAGKKTSGKATDATEGAKNTKTTVRVNGPQEFIVARDAAYGLWSAVERGYSDDVLHLGGGQGFGFDTLAAEVRALLPEGAQLPEAVQERGGQAALSLSYGHPFLDSARAATVLGWQPRCDIREGVCASVQSVVDQREAAHAAAAAAARKGRAKRLWRRAVPYVENLAGAVLMCLIAYVQGGSPVNRTLPVDFNFVYIGAFGLLYGKRQAVISVAASLAILIVGLTSHGAELVSLLYNPIELLHFVSYLFVGVLTGYFADRADYERAANAWKEQRAAERQSFLKNLFQESVRVKDRMYRQIVNSDDSIGRVYRIVRRLDSVEEENLYTQTAAVTADVLNVQNVAVYVVSRDGLYLRQKVRMGTAAAQRPHSLRVDDNDYLTDLFRTQRVFANRALQDGVPDLAAPVVYDERVIAVIEIYDLDFGQWSYYEQNLLSLTARLVAASIGRAWHFEQEAAEKRYLPGTRILKNSEFEKVLHELAERRRVTKDNPAALLPVVTTGLSLAEIDERLSRCIRTEDFAGEYDGGVALLLPDVAGDTLRLVRDRLARAGVETDEGRAVV